MELLLGFGFLFVMTAVLMAILTLIGDILMMKFTTKISWKESIICGWLYFIDRLKK